MVLQILVFIYLELWFLMVFMVFKTLAPKYKCHNADISGWGYFLEEVVVEFSTTWIDFGSYFRKKKIMPNEKCKIKFRNTVLKFY